MKKESRKHFVCSLFHNLICIFESGNKEYLAAALFCANLIEREGSQPSSSSTDVRFYIHCSFNFGNMLSCTGIMV